VFGTISTSGAVTDRFGVGTGFDALTFVVRLDPVRMRWFPS
jgi:hypothetical protein